MMTACDLSAITKPWEVQSKVRTDDHLHSEKPSETILGLHLQSYREIVLIFEVISGYNSERHHIDIACRASRGRVCFSEHRTPL